MSAARTITASASFAIMNRSKLQTFSTRAVTASGDLISFNDDQHPLLEYCTRPSSKIRTLILNRPKALHALNGEMCNGIRNRLLHYEASEQVKLVIIRSNGSKGRAFCAGGDIRSLYLTSSEHEYGYSDNFFQYEYSMNYVCGSLKSTSLLSIWDGIVMGGGVGLSVHGKYRIATENTVFAMPECNIGIYPDAGTTHKLLKLPKGLGMYLGLTGSRLRGKTVKDVGLATHFIRSERIDQLLGRFDTEVIEKDTDVSSILSEFEDTSPAENEIPGLEIISTCFSSESVEKVLERLQIEAGKTSQPDHQVVLEIIETLKQQCPTSLKITFEALKRGASMSFADALRMEYRLTARCARRQDCVEGIKAAVITKTNNPKWEPPQLDQVSKEYVESIFQPLKQDLGIEELQLPTMPSDENVEEAPTRSRM